MTEFIVKSVAFNYSPAEDRVRLSCITEDSSHQIWLTQRMLHQVLPAMTKWLVNAGFGSSQTKSFMASSLKKTQRKPSEKSNLNGALQAEVSAIQGQSSVSGRGEVLIKPRQNDAANWVCTRANIAFETQRMRMRWESETSSNSYVFSMTSIEASHFLMVLRNATKQAGWSCHWPEWLPLIEVEDSLPDSAAFLH